MVKKITTTRTPTHIEYSAFDLQARSDRWYFARTKHLNSLLFRVIDTLPRTHFDPTSPVTNPGDAGIEFAFSDHMAIAKHDYNWQFFVCLIVFFFVVVISPPP